MLCYRLYSYWHLLNLLSFEVIYNKKEKKKASIYMNFTDVNLEYKSVHKFLRKCFLFHSSLNFNL